MENKISATQVQVMLSESDKNNALSKSEKNIGVQ